ncbi:MAG: acetate--CoA ligase family protein [Candidatus Krumholzibacteria bacterium]
MSSPHSLDAIFKPSSIAVIGASPRRGTIGHELLDNLIRYGFNGMVFPVNPKHKFIKSIKCHPTVSSIVDPVDLAIIIVPKEHVLGVAEECGERGVKGLVIISAGFREVGGEGVKREKALLALKEKYGFRIVGPNCMGVINAEENVRMNATFAPLEPKSGSMAFMTQSGALGVAILLAVARLDLGLSYFVSVGNKLDIAGNDLLEYWDKDENTKIIALYLESFGEPRRFTQLSKKITKRKPIILVKSGTTAAGARAASSHTGHLAGLEIAVDALLHQCGVIRVSTIQEMMDVVLAFSKNPMPRGGRIGVLTNAGGPAIMATDRLVNEDLALATLSDKTQTKLRSFLPEESSVRNPVDMIASAGADEYGRALDIMLADDAVDAVIAIFVPPIMVEPGEVVKKITEATRKYDKPVFSVVMAEEKFYEEIPRRFKDAPPVYRFPESAVRALAAMDRQRKWVEQPEGQVKTFEPEDPSVRGMVKEAVASGGGYMPPDQVNRILASYGFPVCRLRFLPADGDVLQATADVGYPLVLKVFGRNITHKSDIGGVVTGIKNQDMLARAHTDMQEKLERAGVSREVEGFLVQEMAQEGKEVIFGMTTDPKFGPVLMFGMGGKYVEIIKDIAFRVMPVTDIDAREMVRSIKSYPLLEGVRGDERVDIEFIEESIQRLAQMVSDWPEILELDMNPVMVTPDRSACRVVDARIRISSGEELPGR